MNNCKIDYFDIYSIVKITWDSSSIVEKSFMYKGEKRYILEKRSKDYKLIYKRSDRITKSKNIELRKKQNLFCILIYYKDFKQYRIYEVCREPIR